MLPLLFPPLFLHLENLKLGGELGRGSEPGVTAASSSPGASGGTCSMATARARTSARIALAILAAPIGIVAIASLSAVSFPRRLHQVLSRRLAALLLTLPTAVFGALFGALLGPAACFLWAVYGPGAPERPWASGPASETRRDCSTDDEVLERISHAAHVRFERTTLLGGALECHIIKPKDAVPRAVVVVQHGLHSHGGCARCLQLGAALSRRGMVAYLPDARGHGRSEGPWAVVRSFDALADDLVSVCKEACSRHPTLPMFLNGESMGGLLTLMGAQRMDEATRARLAGVAAVCPALVIHDDAGSPLLEAFTRCLPLSVLTRLAPRLPVTPGPKGNIFPRDALLNKRAQDKIEQDPLEVRACVERSPLPLRARHPSTCISIYRC